MSGNIKKDLKTINKSFKTDRETIFKLLNNYEMKYNEIINRLIREEETVENDKINKFIMTTEIIEKKKKERAKFGSNLNNTLT
jgi:hypothetical protein